MNSSTIQNPVNVSATQAVGTSGQGSLQLHSKPVILVHGLWGNNDSFSFLMNNASGFPEAQQSGLYNDSWAINPICYSLYIPWDAPTDPVNNLISDGGECEQTSENALDTVLANVLNTLNNLKDVEGNPIPIIGSRFDLVAHSMGGLVARHYATLPQFSLGQNRGQGAFSTVIALDTPESGSALSTYLLENANNPATQAAIQATPYTNDGLYNDYSMWRLAQCTSSDTLQSCLAGRSLPLAYPGMENNCGAVASLQPGYSAETLSGCDYDLGSDDREVGFSNAPFALRNAETAMLGSIYDDQAAPEPSALRAFLSSLMDVVAGSTGNSPDNILGNVPNDVIVTFGSQSNELPPTELGQPFQNLEHAPFLPQELSWAETVFPLSTFSDANVMQSPAVNAQILCLLIAAGSSPACGGPGDIGPEVRQSESRAALSQASSASPQRKDAFFTTGRIEAVAPIGNLKLAEENEIPLRIHTQGLTHLSISQTHYQGDLTGPESKRVHTSITAGSSDVPIEFRSDASAYVRVIPLRLGHIKIDMGGRYPDGGIVQMSLMLNVELPSRSPKRINIGQLGLPSKPAPVAFAFLNPKGRSYALRISAEYDGVAAEIPIDAHSAAFKVRMANGASVIQFDKSTGFFKPLNVGEALIETTFGGWKELTCIDVEDRFDFDLTRPGDCKSLLLPGEKLGTPVRNDSAQ
jgi:pimeloyl-ACP methyl ester carboxylesterase